jgi:glycosyltransferase involved in cell wall biosynthesis
MLVDTLRVSPEKIVWVDNAVDVHRFRPQSAVEARVQLGLSHFGQLVGYVGSRPSERGGQAIVEAAPALLKHFPSLGFLVVGNGPRLDQVRVMARDLGVADRCVFVGHIPPDQVPNYVNALDVGVSINRRSDRFHSAELKVRQYIACGKPVVVTPGGNGFVEDAGLGMVISDERSLVEALASVLRWTSDESTAFSKRARDYAVRELSYERSLERRFDIWSERCFKR